MADDNKSSQELKDRIKSDFESAMPGTRVEVFDIDPRTDAEKSAQADEWTTKQWMSLPEILGSFLWAANMCYYWHWDYKALEGQTEVAQLLGTYLQSLVPHDSVVEWSLNDLKEAYQAFVDATPLVRALNEIGSPAENEVRMVFAETPMGAYPEFVDLGALVTAAAVHMRDSLRRFKAFNADFDARHPDVDRRLPDKTGFWWFHDESCTKAPVPVWVVQRDGYDASKGFYFVEHPCSVSKQLSGQLGVEDFADCWRGYIPFPSEK
jgi:hypothetical protein